MDCSLPDSSVLGTYQERILEWVSISFIQQNLPNPGIKLSSPALSGRFFTTEPPGEPYLPCQQKNKTRISGSF